ncbi:thiolase family protein [soil metagenome]
MKFDNAYLSLRHIWSSPFVRWQGSLADVSSIDLAVAVTDAALTRADMDRSTIGQLVLGTTIPQPNSFYGAPWIAARLGMQGISGPHVAQACATSVSCLVSAAMATELDSAMTSLVVAADRTSNGPLLVFPKSQSAGGAPDTESFVLQSFAADPWTGEAMIATAEGVAKDGAMSRRDIDDLTLLRYTQYQSSLANDRAFQRQWMQPVSIRKGRSQLVVEADEGIHAYSAEGLASLNPVRPDGTTTFGSQTHPADGAAGAIVTNAATARGLAGGDGVVQILSAGYARAEKGRMPKAATMAAQRAVANAGLSFEQMKVVTSHNPFAVNDLWFAQQTGYPLERMNPYGCSLIFGHPQGPTGMRSIVELAFALREQGGGIGLFTGCAAGDTGAAIVISVE